MFRHAQQSRTMKNINAGWKYHFSSSHRSEMSDKNGGKLMQDGCSAFL
jgi:hypothetical protein